MGSEESDPIESRRLFSKFNDSLYLLSEDSAACSYFDLSQLYAEKPRLLGRHEKTVSNLKPSICRSLCEELNRLAYSRRLVSADPSVLCIVLLATNTFRSAPSLPLSEYREVIACLMAVIDSIFLEQLSRVKKGDCHENQ